MLNELHWLPMRKRISLKVLLVLYKAMHGLTPDYITVLATLYVPQCHLRSANDNLLVVNMLTIVFLFVCYVSVFIITVLLQRTEQVPIELDISAI